MISLLLQQAFQLKRAQNILQTARSLILNTETYL
jgi:hypothetical protein